jgi:F-type H+-transporting ATPase subunit b
MNLPDLMFAAADAPWWNYPGFELWKFLNLALFIAAGIILHRIFGRPIGQALNARRESIKAELVRAREERDAALKQLEEVETRLAGMTSEIETIRQKAKAEAAAERERIHQSTELELQKLRETARREIESAGKVAMNDLRIFASKQSVHIAEDLIRRDLRPDDEDRLIRARVEGLGGRAN